MIGQIYKTLQYFIKDRIPEIKYISLYNNQFNLPDSNRGFNLPAVLIEITPINFQNMLQQVQFAEVKVRLHIGTEIYNGFDDGDGMQDSSFQHLEILDKMYIGLNRVNSVDLPDNLKSDLFVQGAFRRDSVQLLTTSSVIHHSIIEGSFILQDGSALKKYTEYELTDITLETYYVPDPPFEGEAQAKVLSIK